MLDPPLPPPIAVKEAKLEGNPEEPAVQGFLFLPVPPSPITTEYVVESIFIGEVGVQ